MRRFWIVTLALIFGSGALIGTARLIGRAQPIAQRVALMHLGDCALPCWIGIEPGQSTLAQARDQITKIFGNSPNYEIKESAGHGQFTIWDKADNLRLGVQVNAQTNEHTDQSVVTTLSLWEYDEFDTPAGKPILVELYSALGDPDNIGLLGGEGTLFQNLLYYQHHVEMTLDQNSNRVSTALMYQPVVELVIYSQMPARETYKYQPLPWRGFYQDIDQLLDGSLSYFQHYP
jgi:hypothetical protein